MGRLFLVHIHNQDIKKFLKDHSDTYGETSKKKNGYTTVIHTPLGSGDAFMGYIRIIFIACYRFAKTQPGVDKKALKIIQDAVNKETYAETVGISPILQ